MKHYAIAIPLASVLLALAAQPAFAENFARGQELFGHQCHACHGDLRYAGQEGKVKTRADLRQAIEGWAKKTGADWGSGEVDDVLLYMDASFYHFDGSKQE